MYSAVNLSIRLFIYHNCVHGKIVRRKRSIALLLMALVACMLWLELNYSTVKFNALKLEIYEYLASSIGGNPDIVFTGDSITLCGGIWAFKINRYDLRTSNIAKGGLDTSAVKDITLRAIEKQPKQIFIMSGRNDMQYNYTNGNAELSISNYKDMLDAIVDKGIKVCVTSTLYSQYELYPQIVDELNAFLRKYCADNGQVFIDLNAMISSNGRLRPEFAADSVHINEKAYLIWAVLVKSVLNKNETFCQKRIGSG